MDLHEMRVEIPTSTVEAVDELLLEHGLEAWSVFEDVIEKRAWVVGMFESVTAAEERWAELRGIVPTEGWGSPQTRTLGEKEWRDSYKAHFKAWKFGPLHWVPVWERENFKLNAGEAVLWLDPGLAFGTGNHETTRLCVERLVTLAAERGTNGRVVDAGCGSGILALSAAKLGFGNVRGFDNDPEAVRVSEENAELNGLADAVEFYEGDLTTGLKADFADILMANILANVLIRYAKELVTAVAPGGVLILSGILAVETQSVIDAFRAEAPNWGVDSRVMGEWSDVVLTRPA